MSLAPTTSSLPPVKAPVTATGNPLLKSGKADTQAEKFSFFDFLDIINPLQHIPIVNNIYREITGDKINNAARIAGGALYGGIIGAAVGVASAVSVNETGQDIGGVAMTKMGLIKGDDTETAANEYAIPSPAPLPEVAAAPLPAAAKTDLPVVEIRPSDKLAKKESIDWNKPLQTAALEMRPDATVQPASALPTPKELNELEPGNTASQETPKPDVQKNMMDALSKYSAMQKVSDQSGNKPNFTNLMSSPTTPVATAAAAQPSHQFRKLRHY